MGVRFVSGTPVSTIANTGAGGEQANCVISVLNSGLPGQPFVFVYGLSLVQGATPTNLGIRIRRGNGITGTIIYDSGTIPGLATGTNQQYSGVAIDAVVGEVSTQYTLTLNPINAPGSVSVSNLVLVGIGL